MQLVSREALPHNGIGECERASVYVDRCDAY